MNDFYKLASSLGAPIVIEPEWSECKKLVEEGNKLLAEGYKLVEEKQKLWNEGYRLWNKGYKLKAEGYKLWDEGNNLVDKGMILYRGVVEKYVRLDTVNINWTTGKVRRNTHDDGF